MAAPRTGLAAVLVWRKGCIHLTQQYSCFAVKLSLKSKIICPLGTSRLKQETGEPGGETNVLESPHQTQLGLAGRGSYSTCSSSAVTSRNSATGTSLLVQAAAGDPLQVGCGVLETSTSEHQSLLTWETSHPAQKTPISTSPNNPEHSESNSALQEKSQRSPTCWSELGTGPHRLMADTLSQDSHVP